MNNIEKAYKAGQEVAEKYSSVDEAIMCSDKYDGYLANPDLEIPFSMGFDGMDLEYVTGWRYGEIPKNGRSVNHMDNRYERGVSLMAIDGEGFDGITSITEMFIKNRPVIRVGGYYSGRGVDGEPLVIGAEKI